MACDCKALKAEVLSQRELMTEWFQTLMIEIRDSKVELVELIKANTFNIGKEQRTTDQQLTGQQSSIAAPIAASEFLESINSPLQYYNGASDSLPVSLSLEPIRNQETEQTPDPCLRKEHISAEIESTAEKIPFEFSLTQNEHTDGILDEQAKDALTLNQFSSVGSANLNKTVKNEQSVSMGKPFACDQYEYKCLEKQSLARRKRFHTDKKSFRCVLCQKHFKHHHDLTRHMMTHTGEKPFVCDQCGFRTNRKAILKNHQRLHTGEKPFQCDFCNYRAASKSVLNHHTKFKHQGQV